MNRIYSNFGIDAPQRSYTKLVSLSVIAKLLRTIHIAFILGLVFVCNTYAQKMEDGLFFEGKDSQGKRIALKEWQGKTVLISFFTAGCNLCVRELKAMREFYSSHKSKQFMLIAISLDSDERDFLSYEKILGQAIPAERRFPLVWRAGKDFKDNFGTINAQPTHFVIDKNGALVMRREGAFDPKDWAQLKALL